MLTLLVALLCSLILLCAWRLKRRLEALVFDLKSLQHESAEGPLRGRVEGMLNTVAHLGKRMEALETGLAGTPAAPEPLRLPEFVRSLEFVGYEPRYSYSQDKGGYVLDEPPPPG